MQIFYSWQSDLPNANNRSFIQSCLDKVVKKYKSILKIEADRDTQNRSGSPDITETVFSKIDTCDLFVADISIVNAAKRTLFSKPGRPTPNPNVLLELGYAAARLGWERIICLYNTDWADLDALPFDLRQHRITTYSLNGKKDTERASEKEKVITAISRTINALIESGNAERQSEDHAHHVLLGYDFSKGALSQRAVPCEIPFLKLRDALRQDACKFAAEAAAISVSGCPSSQKQNKQGWFPVQVPEKEKQEVSQLLAELLDITVGEDFFQFGNLWAKRDLFTRQYAFHFADEKEKEKYRSYISLKWLLSQIYTLDALADSLRGYQWIPLVIHNDSRKLDQNIKITLRISHSDTDPITPSLELFPEDFLKIAGYVSHYGLLPPLFHISDLPGIPYANSNPCEMDEELDLNPYINFWDEDCYHNAEIFLSDLERFVASPAYDRTYAFNVQSLQANESKRLNRVLLIRPGTKDFQLEYTILSDCSDGKNQGKLESAND